MTSQMRFGIPKNQYEKIIEAHSLEGLYDFSSMFSDVAFELAETLNISLKDTFRYADSLRDFGGDFSGSDDDPEDPTYSLCPPEENLREVAFDPFIQFVFFRCSLSVSSAYDLLERTGLTEEKLMQIDPRLLHEYAFTYDINFRFFERAYHYYMQHRKDLYCENDYTQEDFDSFVDRISVGQSIEEAFASIIPSGILDYDHSDFSPSDSEEDFYDDAFDHMVSDEECWKEKKIDADFDEDSFLC